MTEIITDPAFATFGQPGSKWRFIQHETVQLHGRVEEEAMMIVQTGAKGIHWHGEFCFAPFALHKGSTVHLSFQARSHFPTGFSAWIGMFRSPWTSLIRAEDHFGQQNLGETWKTFTLEAEIQQNEPAARLNFAFGEKDNTISFKAISLKID